MRDLKNSKDQLDFSPVFKTNEFARICGTTKATLFHYDKLGILCPKRDEKTGYRYYSPGHFFEYDTIHILKAIGCSLDEIAEMIKSNSVDSYEELLQMHLQQLNKQIEEINNQKRRIQESQSLIRESRSAVIGVPSIVAEPNEKVLFTSAIKSPDKQDSHVAAIGNLLSECLKTFHGPAFHIGAIVRNETLLKGETYRSYYYSTVFSEDFDDSERITIRPAGRYLVYYHKGHYTTLDRAYEKIFEYIHSHGLVPAGNSYEDSLVTYFNTSAVTDHITKISVQIK